MKPRICKACCEVLGYVLHECLGLIVARYRHLRGHFSLITQKILPLVNELNKPAKQCNFEINLNDRRTAYLERKDQIRQRLIPFIFNNIALLLLRVIEFHTMCIYKLSLCS